METAPIKIHDFCYKTFSLHDAFLILDTKT